MKIYRIDNYKIHLNKKKERSCGSIFTVYKNNTRGKIGDGFLRYESEEQIEPRLKRLLEEW